MNVYSSMHNCNHVEFTYAYDLSENLALCVGPLTALLICLQIRENSSYSLSLSLSYLLLSGILTGLPGQRSSDDRWACLR